MTDARRRDRYGRIAAQLADLFAKTEDPVARMATIAGVLDVDSVEPDAFDAIDGEGLERICGMIYDGI